MILSDKAIMSLLKEGTLSISPLQENQIQPASVDIRLGSTFSIVEDSSAPILTFTEEMAYKEIHAQVSAHAGAVCFGNDNGIHKAAG